MVTGIDCSKDFLDIAITDDSRCIYNGKFSNNRDGFNELLAHIKDSSLVVMEATGPYYLPVAFFCYEHGISVSVVNPLIIRRFCQMRMSRAKTDKKDAVMIARYGESEKPSLWKAPSDLVIKLQQIRTYIAGIEKRKSIVYNQYHAFSHTSKLSEGLAKEMELEIKEYDKKIAAKEKELAELMQKEYGSTMENLKSIPGIGEKSATLLVITTDSFKNFESYKQVISYYGLSPRIFESGKSVKGKAHICKMGMSQVRKTLYMAAKSAIRYNKPCRDLYERLRLKGKPYRVALIAAVNKLIKQAFAVTKNNVRYSADFVVS